MTKILSIDPGPTESGWVHVESEPFALLGAGVFENESVLEGLRRKQWPADVVLIEKVVSYMKIVGLPVFETAYNAGRFAEAAHPASVVRLGNTDVRRHICDTARASESNVRAAIIDRFGGLGGKAVAIGTSKARGPLYGVTAHAWSALALALTFADDKLSAAAVRIGAASWEEMHDAKAGGQ